MSSSDSLPTEISISTGSYKSSLGVTTTRKTGPPTFTVHPSVHAAPYYAGRPSRCSCQFLRGMCQDSILQKISPPSLSDDALLGSLNATACTSPRTFQSFVTGLQPYTWLPIRLQGELAIPPGRYIPIYWIVFIVNPKILGSLPYTAPRGAPEVRRGPQTRS